MNADGSPIWSIRSPWRKCLLLPRSSESLGSIRRIDSKVELFLWLTLARMRTWTHWTTKSPSNLDHQMMTHLSRRGLSHKIAYVAHFFPAEQDQSRSDATHRKTLTFSRKLEIWKWQSLKPLGDHSHSRPRSQREPTGDASLALGWRPNESRSSVAT